MAHQLKKFFLTLRRGCRYEPIDVKRDGFDRRVDRRFGFQRAFMFPLAIVLSLGLWWEDHRVGRYGVALALGGAAIALWHLGLYTGILPERIQPCTATGPSCTDDNQVFLGVPIPLLSLIAFGLIVVLSIFSLKEPRT